MTYNPIKTLISIASHPGNKNNKIRAISRYFKWQIGSRLLGFQQVMPWIDDAKLYIRPGEAMVTHNLYTGVYEYYDMLFLLHCLTKEDEFLDIGANSGVYTVLAGAVLGVKVVAFEPIPDTYSRLLDNINLNHIGDKVTPINKGLSDKNEVLSFVTNLDATNHVSIAPLSGSAQIPVVKLDDELKKIDFIPTVMKIDVEGFEKFVLKGASKLLGNPKLNVIIIELNSSGKYFGVEDGEILELLIGCGFQSYDYNPDTHLIESLNNKISKRQNTLFIRDLNLILDDLHLNKTYIIHNQ
jgi:FkbM family methyltransferase